MILNISYLSGLSLVLLLNFMGVVIYFLFVYLSQSYNFMKYRDNGLFKSHLNEKE